MVLLEMRRRLVDFQSQRGILLLLGTAFILGSIGAVSGSIGFASHLNSSNLYPLKDVPHEITFNIASAIITLMLFIGVYLSPSLCEESTMVVHTSLVLFMLHLNGYLYSLGPSVAGFVWVIPAALSIIINMGLMAVFAIMAILNCNILHGNDSSWPKSQFLRFFTCDSLLLLSRLVPSSICLGMWFVPFPAAVQCLADISVLLNFCALIENLMSVFWGVVHRKMFGVENIVVAALLFLTFVAIRIVPSDNVSWQYAAHGWTVWLFVATALPLLHGILSLRLPHLVNAPPNLFKQFWLDHDHHATVETSVATTTSSGEQANGSSIYNRLFRSGSFSSLVPEHTTAASGGVTAAVAGHRWTLRQLATRCPPFLRHTIYSVLGLVVVLVNYPGLVMNHYSYRKWGPIIVLCVGACVVLRSGPALVTMLCTRRPVPDPSPVQVAGYVIIESLLGVIGALGTFIDDVPRDSEDFAYIFTGILLLLLAVLQFLHVNGLVRGMKIEAAAATSV
ncbi:uncharacterized protein LOC108666816 [Hyalella azteca]|uniref:Uncharacterized protein LOC108666816 n=1 Tax=Hyalella azteca TaxID=294128 RepID=A0A8B7N7J4_HYAAZ|nr:uncharacterized protein LOC108666816 [Hyalella azteca]